MKFRKNIKESYIDGEQDDVSSNQLGVMLSKTSLDAQVTAYFQRFEQDAAQLTESANYMSMYSNFLEVINILYEQKGEKDNVDDELDAIVSDVENDEVSLAIIPPKPSIDIEKFASNVSSLISNVENKLDFKGPIINMAVDYIIDNYDEDSSNKLIETFRDMGFKIKIEKEFQELPKTDKE